MPLENLNSMLTRARRGNYAVGAFNVYHLQDITAVIEAAEAVRSPVILATTRVAFAHSTLEDLVAVITRRARAAEIPVCLHLDHAQNFDTIVRAIFAGYTSVMFDGSSLPLAENIQQTREVVKVAEQLNVSVEAEIGRVGRAQTQYSGKKAAEADEKSKREKKLMAKFEEKTEDGAVFSNPGEVKQFVEKTGIDACAIAIGSLHGMQKQEASLDFNLLEEIRSRVDIPLVLHGSSGVKERELKEIGARGIQKVNIGTRLQRVFTDEMRRVFAKNKNLHDSVKVLESAREALKKEVIHKIKVLGSNSKARN